MQMCLFKCVMLQNVYSFVVRREVFFFLANTSGGGDVCCFEEQLGHRSILFLALLLYPSVRPTSNGVFWFPRGFEKLVYWVIFMPAHLYIGNVHLFFCFAHLTMPMLLLKYHLFYPVDLPHAALG